MSGRGAEEDGTSCGQCGSHPAECHVHPGGRRSAYEAPECPYAGRAYEAGACSGDDLCPDCADARDEDEEVRWSP